MRTTQSTQRMFGVLPLGSPDRLKAELRTNNAFTVIELLVVIAIIGALTALSVPAIKSMTQSSTTSNAARQLIDDLALARQYAINNRSEVHVVFVPPSILNMTFAPTNEVAKRLQTGVFSTYAIYSERTVGDQPGQSHPRYLTKWKSLPEGIFIVTNEFRVLSVKTWGAMAQPLGRPLLHTVAFPFPTLDPANPLVLLPHITFSPQGSVIFVDDQGIRRSRDEVIELARGSILASRDETTGNLQYFDVRESPPNNSVDNYLRVRIDGLTGRSTLERPSL